MKPSPSPPKEQSRMVAAQAVRGACQELGTHWCHPVISVIMGAGFIAGLITFLVGFFTVHNENETYWQIGIIVMGVCYWIYLINAFCCNRYLRYLCQLQVMPNLFQHIKQLQEAQPQLRWQLTFYHMEQRVHHGGRHRQAHTYTIKVGTWSELKIIPYKACTDVSAPNQLPLARKYKQSAVEFHKAYQIVGENAHERLTAQRTQFISEQRWRDKYFDLKETLEIPGFVDKALVCSGDRKPCFMNGWCYALASVFLCEFPFRLWTLRSAPKDSYTFTKIIEI